MTQLFLLRNSVLSLFPCNKIVAGNFFVASHGNQVKLWNMLQHPKDYRAWLQYGCHAVDLTLICSYNWAWYISSQSVFLASQDNTLMNDLVQRKLWLEYTGVRRYVSPLQGGFSISEGSVACCFDERPTTWTTTWTTTSVISVKVGTWVFKENRFSARPGADFKSSKFDPENNLAVGRG